MVKSVIKEITIMLLLCIAIVLILGILFYDYIPTNKVVPKKEAYTTPENVKEEIEERITELEKTEISYEITGSDLNLYKQSASYKPGKANPFALVDHNQVVTNNTTTNTQNQTNTNNTNQNTNVSTNSTSTNTNSTKTNSTGTFFNDTK